MKKPTVTLATQFGSHLYGTNIQGSDTDVKAIFQPTADEILLGRIQNHRKDLGLANQNTLDCEGFSVQEYLKHLGAGQTFALDMFFTPEDKFFHGYHSYVWKMIRRNKDKLITKKASAFIGYSRAQASKYCVKAARLNAVTDVLRVLDKVVIESGLYKLVSDIASELEDLTFKYPAICEFVKDINGDTLFSCCGRKVSFKASIRVALEIYGRVYDDYGERTKTAASLSSADYKALYHAVRISEQCKELLSTGHITFPRPEAQLLLDIRNQKIPANTIFDMVERGLDDMESLMSKSTLRDEPDYKWIDWFIKELNFNEVDEWEMS